MTETTQPATAAEQKGAEGCPFARMPFDDTYHADPYATYALMHGEGKVHRIETPVGAPSWYVTGYEEVRQGLGDKRLVRNIKHASAAYRDNLAVPSAFLSNTLASEDPPNHTRLRKFMNRAFAIRRIRALRPRIEEITEQLIDAMGESGETDLVSALAAPLPITVIGDMLGVPEEDRGNFAYWSDTILSLDRAASKEAGDSMLAFLQGLIAKRRTEPGDDVVSEWITTRDDDGNELTEEELVGLGFMMLLGGYDTTVGMIGGAVMALLDNPERLAQLRDDPAKLPDAVEEFLRYYGTAHTSARRFAAEDFELGGTTIHAGDQVMLCMAAADRDPERFEDPDTLSFDRPDNHHVAFGYGPHYCPGSELARLEMSVALEAVLRRLPNLALKTPVKDIPWRRAYLIRIPTSIPVSY
uniref:Cytochrome P450 n=1 Tax=Streptomyces sp. NBC_00003 TaxID=2903608 RepID=A0AAU2V622_9ACTN